MPSSVTLTNVIKEPKRVLVRFSDAVELEFPTMADLVFWAQQADTDLDLTRQFCVAYALARSSDLSNIGSVRNKTFSFDLSDPNPIKVQ